MYLNEQKITKTCNNFTVYITYNESLNILKIQLNSHITNESFQGNFNNMNLPDLAKQLFQNTYYAYLYILDNFKDDKLITPTAEGNLQVLVITKIGRFQRTRTVIMHAEIINGKDESNQEKRQFEKKLQVLKEDHDKVISGLKSFYEKEIERINREYQIRLRAERQSSKPLHNQIANMMSQLRETKQTLKKCQAQNHNNNQKLSFLIDSGIIDKSFLQQNSHFHSRFQTQLSAKNSQLKSKGLIHLKFNFQTIPSKKYLFDNSTKTIQRVKDPGVGYQIISAQPLPKDSCHFNLRILTTCAGNIGIGIVTEKDAHQWDSKSKQSIFYIVWNGEIFKNGEVSQKCRPINKGDQIRVQINQIDRKILWFANNVKVGSEQLVQNFISQKIYVLLKMRDCGDKIQLL